MQPKTERFEMRLDERTLKRVDAWRGRQHDLPSRAESMRRLIDVGLASTTGSPVKFDDGSKLLALMLCDVYKHLKIDGGVDPAFVEAALCAGHYWALKWEYPGIFHDHEDRESVVTEVVDILDMWSFIEGAYKKLSKKDKDRVEEAAPFGKQVTFIGFDGNNESGYVGIARFLIEKMKRFTEFSGRGLNSHMPKLDDYRRMLVLFEPMRVGLVGISLSASQIIELLNAEHPQHRTQVVEVLDATGERWPRKFFIDHYLKGKGYKLDEHNRARLARYLDGYPGERPVSRAAATEYLDKIAPDIK